MLLLAFDRIGFTEVVIIGQTTLGNRSRNGLTWDLIASDDGIAVEEQERQSVFYNPLKDGIRY
jgi:hypothetical protein